MDVTAARRLCASVGDDKQLMLWDAVDCELLAKTALKVGGGSYADRIACMYVIKVSNIHLYAIYMYGCLNTCKYVCIYCIWVHLYTNVHAYIHTYIHTYTMYEIRILLGPATSTRPTPSSR